MSEQDWFTKDFYKELGVDKTADEATIKKAYRKLARKYHPDQNPGDTAAEARFKEISEAYTVLSDKDQRSKYDAIRQMAGGGARFAPGGGAGFEDLFGGMFGGGSFRSSQGFSGGNVEDLLGGLFGGGSGFSAGGFNAGASPFGGGDPFGGSHTSFGGAHSPFGDSFNQRSAPKPKNGADLKSAVTLSLRQALKGTEIRLKVNGSPLNARIPAGVKDGQKIKISGKGKPGSHGGKAGDLIVTVSVSEHPLYSREGNDLHIHVPVTLSEAVHGAQVTIPALDGSLHSVTIPAGSSSGKIIRLAGQGVRTAKSVGDLCVHVEIALPENLSEPARESLESFAEHTADFDPRAHLSSQV